MVSQKVNLIYYTNNYNFNKQSLFTKGKYGDSLITISFVNHEKLKLKFSVEVSLGY